MIPLFKVHVNENIDTIVGKTLKSGMITQSTKVDEFETALKEWFGYPWILTLNSATSGLTLAYRLLNAKPGDEVISTPLTCFATNCAILANNLDIVWADTDLKTCNIDLEDVKSKITEKTKILTFVHWGGKPVNLDKVEELKQYTRDVFGHELQVVEDCAHAFGSDYNYKKLGTHGNICVFSLQAIKHLTTGDGGLIFLPNKEMYERAKLLRWYGIDREKRSLPGKDFRLKSDIPEYGYKFHMNDINASIGLANLQDIDNILEKCQTNGWNYNKKLSSYLEDNEISGLELLHFNHWETPCYWIYTFRVLNGRKDEFIEFMGNHGIVVSQVHARNDNNSCVLKYKTPLPNLDIMEKEIVSIPVGWWLTKKDTNNIMACLVDFFISKSSQSVGFFIENLKTNTLDSYRFLLFQMTGYKGEEVELFDYNEVYLLRVNGDIVSTAKLHIEDKLFQPVGHIEDVITNEKYRRLGYGKMLIKHLINEALEVKNCYKVVLSCKDELSEFYKSCGMVRTGVSFSKYRRLR